MPRTGKGHDNAGRKLPDRARRDRAMRIFIEHVDDALFQEALELCPEPKFEMLVSALADPRHQSVTFGRLCRKFNVSLQEVHDIWRNHQLHIGLMQMMNGIPRMLRDMVEDTYSTQVCCPRCDGLKRVVDGDGDAEGGSAGREATGRAGGRANSRACPVCEGSGLVRRVGDKTAREIVAETVGIIGKKAPLMAVQNNYGLDAGLEEVLMTSQRVLRIGSGSSSDSENS